MAAATITHMPHPLHISGNSAFMVPSSAMGEDHALASTEIEFYADDQKVIAWIAPVSGPPTRLVFRERHAVAAATLLIRSMSSRCVTHSLVHDDVLCSACLGLGWVEDISGVQDDCPTCAGFGYQNDATETDR